MQFVTVNSKQFQVTKFMKKALTMHMSEPTIVGHTEYIF